MNHSLALAGWLSLVCLTPLTAAPVDLGKRADSTPYDRYMEPVKKVLGSLAGHGADLPRVQSLLRQGRAFHYRFTEPYLAALPEVTDRTRTGDCKAKSLWLADRIGDPSIRYVIGKARALSPLSHAWLLWNDGETWWILDPTNNARPLAADQVEADEYIPLYSWSKNATYRHGGVTAAAGNRQARPTAGATGEQR